MITGIGFTTRRVAPLLSAFCLLAGCSLLVLGLEGCFGEDPSEPPFPPLRQEELAGCWKRELPADTCNVRCFDRSGGYYSITGFVNPLPEVAEDSGGFSISENDLFLQYRLKTTQGKDFRTDGVLHYTIVSDRLRSVSGSSFSGVNYSRVHLDSFPCGMKPWVQFSKPADWPAFE